MERQDSPIFSLICDLLGCTYTATEKNEIFSVKVRNQMADLGYVPPVYDETVDYYSYLGISPHASKDEIRKAYIKKSLQIHPDKHPTAEYIERTKQFQVL